MFSSRLIHIIIFTLIGIASSSPSNHGDRNIEIPVNGAKIQKPTVCKSEECRQIAEEFLAAMNKSVDPCEDFYKFSCGGWATNKPAPKYSSNWSRLKIFENVTNHRIKEALENEIKKTDILPVRQAKKWYQSCMNERSRETRGLKAIESILMQIGGWPMTMDNEEWDEDEYSWQRVDEHFTRLTGEATFFGFSFSPSYNEEPMGNIRITKSRLPFADQSTIQYENYVGDNYPSYNILIKKIAKLLIDHNEVDIPDERLNDDIKDLLDLEKKIYMKNLGPLKTNINPDELEHYPNLFDFINFYDNTFTEITSNSKTKIYWQSSLNQILGMIDIETNNSTRISIQDPKYIIWIHELLESIPKRTIINYIHWKFVREYIRYTNDEAQNILFQLQKYEYGVEERVPRWQECVTQMKMTDAAAYLFVNEYYPKEKEELARKTLNVIMSSIKSQINQSNWMDDESKQSANKKMDALNLLIGFPDWYKNETAVIDNYKGLAIDHEYLDNILSFVRHQKKTKLKEYAGKDQREPWILDPIDVNAMFDRNTIVVPAADFQSPLFEESVPDYVNYGTVGMFIGHELSHGFDDNGIFSGAEFTEDLLSGEMLKIFFQQAKCFTKQYDKYFGMQTPSPKLARQIRFNEEKTMGLLTRGENIADTTGLQAALDAYKLLKTKRPGGELKLPGFEEFNDKQMFFISFAQMWCDLSTPEYEAKRRALDVHSSVNMRVKGAVSNTKDFSDVFNCSSGTPMNPENKCSIWMKPGAQLKIARVEKISELVDLFFLYLMS